MKKLVTIAVAVAISVAVFGTFHHVRAEANGRPGGPFKAVANNQPAAFLVGRTLAGTYIDQAMSDVTVGSGFQPIDSAFKFVCKNVGGCTISAENTVEVGGQTVASNRWGICTSLDGTVGAGICTYQGYIPSDGSYVTGSFKNALAVSTGTHTIQSYLYTDSGAFLAQYNNTYHQYRP
jgi:hypothetical protein